MVIQRWQSVYLLAATILMVLYSFLPIAQFDTGNIIYSLSPLGLKADSNSGLAISQSYTAIRLWGLLTLSCLIGILSIITIFLYKRLDLQMKMCVVNIILTLGLIGSFAVMAVVVSHSIGEARLSVHSSNALPLCSIILYLMAYRSIKKDRKILNSYDRIR